MRQPLCFTVYKQKLLKQSRMSFQYSTLSDANVAPTSQVRTPSILLLLIAGNQICDAGVVFGDAVWISFNWFRSWKEWRRDGFTHKSHRDFTSLLLFVSKQNKLKLPVYVCSPVRIFFSILFSDLFQAVFHSYETTNIWYKVKVVLLPWRFQPWSKSYPYPLHRMLGGSQITSQRQWLWQERLLCITPSSHVGTNVSD
jgi:hypothetical protein